MREPTGRVEATARSTWTRSIAALVLTATVAASSKAGDQLALGTRSSYQMNYDGRIRKYVAHVPPCYDGATPLPIVVALHGGGGDAESFLDETHWAECADQNGFITLAPEGLPLHASLPAASLANARLWNTGQFGRKHSHSLIDDSGFIVAVLDEASARWRVDPRKVYVAGYSNGGAMAFRAAAEHADRFTAVASVSGLCWLPEPQPSRALPTLFIVGTLDPVVPIQGGLRVLPWEVRPGPPVRKIMSRWAGAIGCSTTPNSAGRLPDRNVEVEEYGSVGSGAVLRAMYVRGQGHAWPGGRSLRPERLLGPDVSRFSATDAVWAFFQQWSW